MSETTEFNPSCVCGGTQEQPNADCERCRMLSQLAAEKQRADAAEARAAGLESAFNLLVTGGAVVSMDDDKTWGAVIGVRMIRGCDTALEAVLALLAPAAEEGGCDGNVS